MKKMLPGLIVVLFMAAFVMGAHAADPITREDAVKAIEKAEGDISELKEAGFSVMFFNDTLALANEALERADFAELLKSGEEGELAEKAREVLEGMDYEGFSYADVIVHTDEIAEKKIQVYALSDAIRAVEIKAERYLEQGIGIEDAENLILAAKEAFGKERYTETAKLISEAENNLEGERAKITTLNVIVKSGTSFIERNINEVLAAVGVILIAAWILWMLVRRGRVKKELKWLNAEKEALKKLMKKTQEERFKKSVMPRSVYEMRMDKYRKRMGEIDARIPVLRGILRSKKVEKGEEDLS